MLETIPSEFRTDAPTPRAKQPSPKYLDSGALFEDAQEIRIDHDGQEYRLRQTRNGKLILTK
jgi:hemin uptake protein HemP